MNFIKNFKAKSPKAFWSIIVVVVALVVIGFVNNNNNGTPFSFSKTPEKMIEDGGNSKAWKVQYSNLKQYWKFKSNHSIAGSDDNENYDNGDEVKYNFTSNDSLTVNFHGTNEIGDVSIKDLKVVNNQLKGTFSMKYNGSNVNTDITLTPVD